MADIEVRQFLVKVWQGQPIKVKDFLSLGERFDFETLIEVLRDLTEENLRQRITVNEAEEKLEESLLLKERRKKCSNPC